MTRLAREEPEGLGSAGPLEASCRDRKSTRLNSSHLVISYAVFCLKKKKQRCSLSLPGWHTGPARWSLRRSGDVRLFLATREQVSVTVSCHSRRPVAGIPCAPRIG